ncbi:aromatic ring-hydroxylating dioxygenase subunit alpha [Flavobacteriaceae bacterium TP-CH-4]|uniref:Aromatic ring-hydroxylating dioxygenase subunit alpha n=1 Tax=Pelagihabitans pacificus TaxID=2696054 RepID=A0A967E4M5_9FLAO|nr:aromatic ring-hydroxylating dioxygenase subunit alpha [Pelagihabitans pacificus]NHF58547.1 aromatic ring-hydroxylating dioxygenase subunit alpha [Pelagihabitans pacificus]
MSKPFHIDKDITKAETLPASFYRDSEVFEKLKEAIFYRSWQWIGHENMLNEAANVHPFVLLDGFLTEPMVLTKDSEGHLHCLSNVCTHRGNLVVDQTGKTKKLICGYHGRRFSLNGSFEHMPEFKETRDFPRPCDHLYRFPLRHWGPFLFAGLEPSFDFQQVIDGMNNRVGFLPLEEFKLDISRSKDYFVDAHWALYCDNYLEGFHIPFVHEDLDAVLDYGDYDTVLHPYMNLQIGYSEGSEHVFDLPEGHMDYGKKVAAYYYWVFPNMMFNFYPWGLSINLVQPLGTSRTKVSFLSYVWDASKLDQGAGAILDKVELEDEKVVHGVQKGVRSRFYKAGRFSPTREKGVHHFHSLLANFLNTV